MPGEGAPQPFVIINTGSFLRHYNNIQAGKEVPVPAEAFPDNALDMVAGHGGRLATP